MPLLFMIYYIFNVTTIGNPQTFRNTPQGCSVILLLSYWKCTEQTWSALHKAFKGTSKGRSKTCHWWQASVPQTCPQVPFPQIKAINCPQEYEMVVITGILTFAYSAPERYYMLLTQETLWTEIFSRLH